MKFWITKLFTNKPKIKLLYKTFKKEHYYKTNHLHEVGLWLIDKNQLTSRKDLFNDYRNLLKGLDKNSIITVNKLLLTLQSSTPNEAKDNSIIIPINKEDKDVIKKVYTDFTLKILAFDNGCFAYQNYLLPMYHFEASVLYFKHGIDTLTNLDKIKNKHIIDVGGFIGDSAIVFAEYTDQKIYSFEP